MTVPSITLADRAFLGVAVAEVHQVEVGRTRVSRQAEFLNQVVANRVKVQVADEVDSTLLPSNSTRREISERGTTALMMERASGFEEEERVAELPGVDMQAF